MLLCPARRSCSSFLEKCTGFAIEDIETHLITFPDLRGNKGGVPRIPTSETWVRESPCNGSMHQMGLKELSQPNIKKNNPHSEI